MNVEVQEQVTVWNQRIEEYGMKISVEKSKTVMMTRSKRKGRGNIEVNGNLLEIVKRFLYLGSILTEDGTIREEIGKRIQQANGFYRCVRGLVWNQEVPEKCKEVLFSMNYTPILTYAAGTWTITKRNESRIQAAEMKLLRGKIRKTRRDKIRNVDIRERTGFSKLQEKIDQ